MRQEDPTPEVAQTGTSTSAGIRVVWNEPNLSAGKRARVTTKLLENLRESLHDQIQQEMDEILEDAVTHGLHPSETAGLLQSKFGEVLDSAEHRMVNIARTEQLDAYRAGAQAAELANADVLQGWQWVSVLSVTSCPSCVAMHGTIHDLEERGPDDHPQGRCFRVPVAKTWRQMGIDMDSQPSLTPDAGEWFSGLNEAERRQLLGNRGYEAWAAGKYPMGSWAKRVDNPGWRSSVVPAAPPRLN